MANGNWDPRTKAELLDEINQLQQENADVQDMLDAIQDVLSPPEDEGDEDEDDDDSDCLRVGEHGARYSTAMRIGRHVTRVLSPGPVCAPATSLLTM